MDYVLLILIILYIVVYITATVWVCSEADKRENVSTFKTTILCLFFSPIAGILYLLLFPRIEINKHMSKASPRTSYSFEFSPSDDRKLEKGDVVINLRNGKEVIIDGINDDGRYICFIDRDKVYTSLFAANQIATKEEYSKIKDNKNG